MNQNKFLSLINTLDQTTKYYIDPKTDGSIEFNSLLLQLAENDKVPVYERVNYLYIVFKNVMEVISKDFNGLEYKKFKFGIASMLAMLMEINRISKSIDYRAFHPRNEPIKTCQLDILNDEIQPILLHHATMTGCRLKDTKMHWFDGNDAIPMAFFRDFSFSFVLNEIWHHKDELQHDLNAMQSQKIRLIVAWVSRSLSEEKLKELQGQFLAKGFMLIFMDVNLYNGANHSENMEHFLNIASTYHEYDYFNKHAFERVIRVPRESFDEVVDFYDQAAHRDDVTDIFISFYRANLNGRLIRTLIDATHRKKSVHIYVELSARGDELNNAALVKKLQNEADPDYLRLECSYLGIKIHAKIGMVYMADGRTICHIGTGNLNESTAKLYTDIHRITDDAEDVIQVEEAFTAMVQKVPIKQRIKDILIWEIRNQTAMGFDGRIMLKCNHAIDDDLVRELKRAEACGVSVKTIVRSSPGAIQNTVTLIGQRLEHERVYCFGNGNRVHTYISSSDLMFRNLYKRMEMMTQIKTPEIAQQIMEELWNLT
ncbi:MAG: hypothetical protein NC548_05840 [Lachnospiraceae bacterium]|nr:hypothetical protein [Lachnospiraceae bacterium]